MASNSQNGPLGRQRIENPQLGKAGDFPQLSTTSSWHPGSFMPKPDSRSKRPFVVLKGKEGGRHLTNLNPFVIERQLKALVHDELADVQKLVSGELLLKCKNDEQAQKLFEAKLFGGLPCVAESHRGLNQSKGVIRSSELRGVSDEEITKEIHGVVHSRRMKVWRSGSSHETNSILLTFDSCIPPSEIKAGYLKLDVQIYIPNPLRCFNCQKFGHSKARCRHRQVCANCGQPGHEHKNCKNKMCCPNCSGGHTAFDKQCPEWMKEKEIQRYKAENGCTFPAARKAVYGPGRSTRPKASYTNVAKKGHASSPKHSMKQQSAT